MLKSSTRYRLILAASILTVLVAACGAPSAADSISISATPMVVATRSIPQEVQPVEVAPADGNEPTSVDLRLPEAGQQAVARARADLAQRLGVSPENIELLSAQHRVTAKASVDGAGWHISLISGEQRYSYQVNAAGRLSFVQ